MPADALYKLRKFKSYAIISLGFGAIIGYSVHGYPTFENIKSLIFTGVSVGGALGLIIEGVGILRDWLKEKNEKLLRHSELLVDKNLKFRTKTGVYFAYENILDLQIKTNVSIGTLGFDSDFSYSLGKPYSEEVDSHLKSGYFKEVWEHGKERDERIKEHNAKAQEFLNNIIQRISTEIKEKNPSLIKWDKPSQAPTKHFHIKNISYDAGYVVQSSYERIFDIDKYCIVKQENNRWNIAINYVLAESDNENEMQEIKQVIKIVLDDALTGEHFKSLKEYQKNIKMEHDLFVTGLDEIIKDVENGILLKGRCRICQKFSKIV